MYIRFNEEIFDTFETTFQVNRQEVINIPTQYLTEFNDNSKIILPRLYNEPDDEINRERLIRKELIDFKNSSYKKLYN